MKKTRILFVCMGNICRSPSAEGVLRQQAQVAQLAQHLEFDSAGTHAGHIGEAPDQRSIKHAQQRGYDIRGLGTSKNRNERSRYCAEKRSFAIAKRGSQAREMPAQ